MLSAIDPTIGVLGVALITALVAPTWLSWWNTRQTKKEFKPNGGSSIRDSLNRLEISVAATRQTSLTLASVIGVAYFQTDAAGGYVYVSRDWQRMTEMFAEESMGSGWIEAVDQRDRGMVLASWNDAVKTGRPWRVKCKLADGLEVLMMANPIKSHSGVVEGFVGFYEVDNETEQKAPEFS